MDHRAQSIRDASYSYTSEVLPFNFQRAMDHVGDQRIVEATIEMHPLAGVNQKILNVLSRGKFEKQRKKMHYDSFMHAVLHLKTDKGVWISTDKVQSLSANVSTNAPTFGPNAISHKVDIAGDNKTFRSMINDAVGEAGSFQRLASYHPTDANCQLFIKGMLGDSLDNRSREFLLQDVGEALGKVLKGGVSKLVRFAGLFSGDETRTDRQIESDLMLLGSGAFDETTLSRPIPGYRPSGVSMKDHKKMIKSF